MHSPKNRVMPTADEGSIDTGPKRNTTDLNTSIEFTGFKNPQELARMIQKQNDESLAQIREILEILFQCQTNALQRLCMQHTSKTKHRPSADLASSWTSASAPEGRGKGSYSNPHSTLSIQRRNISPFCDCNRCRAVCPFLYLLLVSL